MHDTDVDAMSREEAIREIRRIRQAVLLDSQRQLNDMCWDRSELWRSVLPGFEPQTLSVMPVASFLGNCLKYRLSLPSMLLDELNVLSLTARVSLPLLLGDCEDRVSQELGEAGIDSVDTYREHLSPDELNCAVGGLVQVGSGEGWLFRRCKDYYWAAGPGIPTHAAEILHRRFSADLLAGGEPGASPTQLAGNFSISLYHVRSRRALRALAALLTGLRHEPASIARSRQPEPTGAAEPSESERFVVLHEQVQLMQRGQNLQELCRQFGRDWLETVRGHFHDGHVCWYIGGDFREVPLVELQRYHAQLLQLRPELGQWQVFNGMRRVGGGHHLEGIPAPSLRPSEIVDEMGLT